MQGGYKAAAMSGVKSAPAANGSGANGVKKPNAKKKPATTDKAKSDVAEAPAASRAPPPGFAKPAATPNAWATPLPAVAAPAGFSDSQQRLLRHRALFVFRFLVGKAVEVTLVDASRYVGILDCIDPDDFSIVLKNTQRKSGDDADGFDSGSTVIFKRRQLAHMAAEGVVNYTDGAPALSRGHSAGTAAPGFRTDTEISNRSHEHLFGRELESASSWLDPQLDTGDLEEPNRRKGAGWNQFEANEKLFGVVSTFDENLYTTKLDKTKFSTEKSREAERLAREIERETTGNFHLQEERGQAVHGSDDLDEEAKYSSVDRKHQSSPVSRGPNAYVPPALRNASRPTSAGPTKQKPISPKTQATVKAPATVAATPASSTAAAAVPAPAKTTTTPAPAPATAGAAAPPATAQTPTPSSAVEPAPATPVDTSSQTRKPISFSEAVTGRPAARPSPTLAPAATPAAAPAAAAGAATAKVAAKQERKASTSPKKQPSPKSEKPAKATSPPATKKDKESKAAPAKNQAEKKSTPSEKKSADAKSGEDAKADKKTKAKTESSSKPSPATTAAQDTPTADASATPAAAAAAPAKKTTLNPKAKEFKLNASASAFTPKFAAPPAAPVTSSPYRQPNAAPYGHMHPPPPHPAMGMGYAPGPEEWMYDGMVMDEGEYAAHAYMGYGMPMIPNPPMMQQPMYAPMMPPQQNVRMGRGGGGGYGYNQPGMYNPRGYYGQGAAPGAVPYHGGPGAVPGMPQPPLPPTPADGAGPVETPASPSLASQSAPPAVPAAQRPAANSKNADAPSKK